MHVYVNVNADRGNEVHVYEDVDGVIMMCVLMPQLTNSGERVNGDADGDVDGDDDVECSCVSLSCTLMLPLPLTYAGNKNPVDMGGVDVVFDAGVDNHDADDVDVNVRVHDGDGDDASAMCMCMLCCV